MEIPPLTQKQLGFLLLIIFVNCGTPSIDNASTPPPAPISLDLLNPEYSADPYFNTKFLSDYNTVTKTLIKHEGFEEVTFTTPDGIELNGLMRKKSNALYNIIFCAGFYPGRKEGLASFIKIVPENTNLLFFDARGHGKSHGKFLSTIYRYGIDEHKDVLGALACIKQHNNQPIIVHGICAGALHAAHALSTPAAQDYNIKGLVFDSGLDSPLNATSIPTKHFSEKIIPRFCLQMYSKDTMSSVKERYLCKITSSITRFFFNIIIATLKPILERKRDIVNISNKMEKIKCPVLYIHSDDDNYSPIDTVKSLYEKTTHKENWWIHDKSEHALHHLKHTTQYKTVLNKFLSERIDKLS